MTWLIGRASAILFLAVSILLIVRIIPANTDAGYGGSLQPATLPTIAAAMIGIGAIVSMFESVGRDKPDTAHLRRAIMFMGVLIGAVFAIHLTGFLWAAPLLCLITMLVAGERRLAWLATGTALVPLSIWLVFEVGLGRPLP